MKPEQAEELGCSACLWYRPYSVACGYLLGGQSISRVNGGLVCNKKKGLAEAVAALKKAAIILEDEYPANDDRHPANWGLNMLIRDLEEV
jgi:hypothetical protein